MTKDSELRKLAKEALKRGNIIEVERLYLLTNRYKRDLKNMRDDDD